MRLKVAGLRGVVKRDLPIEFTNEQLTSYGGLEVLRRYFQRIGLHARLRNALADSGMGSDYGASRLALLLVTLFVIGARRLEHLAYVATDPLIRRICGLGTLLAGNTRNSGRSTGRSARAGRSSGCRRSRRSGPRASPAAPLRSGSCRPRRQAPGPSAARLAAQW